MKKLFHYELIGFIFVSVIGTLAHFCFEWSNYNLLIGMFTPVNESVWEHLKLIFFPYLIWSVTENFLIQKQKNYWPAKLAGVITGMTVITAFFYTYTGIIGESLVFLDVFSFFLGVLVAFLTDYIIIRSGKMNLPLLANISIAAFIAIAAIFVAFTFVPPMIPLFRDPQTFTYGI